MNLPCCLPLSHKSRTQNKYIWCFVLFGIMEKAIFVGQGSSLSTRSWDMGDSWASHSAPVNRQHPDVSHRTGPTHHLASSFCPATINAEMYAMAHRLSFTMRCNLSGLIGTKSMLFRDWLPAFIELSVQPSCRGVAWCTMAVRMVCLRLDACGCWHSCQGSGDEMRETENLG